MKVKALSRSASSTSRNNLNDVRPTHRNLSPSSHPLPRAREYTRAVTAAKLDRMFASPFVGELSPGHADAVQCLAVNRSHLCPVVSGAVDGTIRIWDLQRRKMVASLEGHSRGVSGLTFGAEGVFYSCGEDGVVKRWCISPSEQEEEPGGSKYGPLATYRLPQNAAHCFTSISHHHASPQFATASSLASLSIWDPARSTPLATFSDLWGSDDTVSVVRYNPAERDLLAHCSNDRGIGLHDLRASSALQKTVLAMKSNCLEWNPMQPYVLLVGNEDHNCYSFDMRKLQRPTSIYKGHVAAVMTLAWSPTGTEFASGSYDKTIRLFHVRNDGGPHAPGAARDIYHTKRMQRVFAVAYTLDHKYVLSGSDDTNLRLWKARASEKIGQLSAREERSLEYRQALIQKYAHLPEVKRIHKSRRVPNFVKKQTEMAMLQKEKRRRKEENVVKHSKEGTVGYTDDKKKVVVKTVD